MKGPDVLRLAPGTVTFQMTLDHPVWSYNVEPSSRLVDVEVEIRALLKLSSAEVSRDPARPTLAGKRIMVEEAARRIIDREGPNFTQPVRVRATDVTPQFASVRSSGEHFEGRAQADATRALF